MTRADRFQPLPGETTEQYLARTARLLYGSPKPRK
jgi:hypothetical protein